MRLKTYLIHYLFDHHLSYMVNRRWLSTYGHKIDWNNPQDINEKMWWLVCFGSVEPSP